MKRSLRPLSLVLALSLLARPALPFCGFYVAKADAKLFNRASQVVLARDGDRTVLTMANDFRGDPTEFAVVVPVPTFLTKEQIHQPFVGVATCWNADGVATGAKAGYVLTRGVNMPSRPGPDAASASRRRCARWSRTARTSTRRRATA